VTIQTELDLEQLYETQAERIYGFAFRMLGRRDVALDVVQETFAVALADPWRFRGESAPSTWLFAIARNLCLKRARPKRERTFEDFEAIVEAHGRSTPSTHTAQEREHYLAEVKQGCLIGLVGCLPLSQRSVFVLHVLNDMTIADVARIMDKTPNAVRILLSRAKSRLRQFLCRHCAFLNGTDCACENLIDFSLDRGLIARYESSTDTTGVIDELRRFEDELALYRSLTDPAKAVAAALQSGRFAIFARE
jgi:RNA polymerase sigma factor (sigma-70 family)